MTTRNNAHARAGITAALGEIEQGNEMAGNTPGPWHVRNVEKGWVTVARVGYAPTICHLGDAQEVDANARLIAAAPDLLAALEETHKLLDDYLAGRLVVYPSAIRHQSRAAIAKARGQG